MTLTCIYPYKLWPFFFSEACWRRNQNCSVCYSRGGLTCTERRNLPSDLLLTWNKSSVRDSRNCRRYWPISVHLMFLITEMEVKSFARCKALQFSFKYFSTVWDGGREAQRGWEECSRICPSERKSTSHTVDGINDWKGLWRRNAPCHFYCFHIIKENVMKLSCIQL